MPCVSQANKMFWFGAQLNTSCHFLLKAYRTIPGIFVNYILIVKCMYVYSKKQKNHTGNSQQELYLIYNQYHIRLSSTSVKNR